MTGFRIALRNVRLKQDPDGRVHLVRVHKMQAGKSRRVLEARAKQREQEWKDAAAEHYTPINFKETLK